MPRATYEVEHEHPGHPPRSQQQGSLPEDIIQQQPVAAAAVQFNILSARKQAGAIRGVVAALPAVCSL